MRELSPTPVHTPSGRRKSNIGLYTLWRAVNDVPVRRPVQKSAPGRLNRITHPHPRPTSRSPVKGRTVLAPTR
jgi:hypothetical protein